MHVRAGPASAGPADRGVGQAQHLALAEAEHEAQDVRGVQRVGVSAADSRNLRTSSVPYELRRAGRWTWSRRCFATLREVVSSTIALAEHRAQRPANVAGRQRGRRRLAAAAGGAAGLFTPQALRVLTPDERHGRLVPPLLVPA